MRSSPQAPVRSSPQAPVRSSPQAPVRSSPQAAPQAAPRSTFSQPSSRGVLFPMLVGELVKESLLSQAHGSKLLGLFGKDSPVINAAMDVYDLDNDLAELVDTLQRAVIVH